MERAGFRLVYPRDRGDLLKLIENNARLCGVIFDWDKYNLALCDEISALNKMLPIYAFANTSSTLDVSMSELRLNVRFFEYTLGSAQDIALKIRQSTDQYIDAIMPPLTKALFKYVHEEKYTFCTPGHMGELPLRKARSAPCFMISTARIPCAPTSRSRSLNWDRCWITAAHTARRKSISPVPLTPNAAISSPTVPRRPTRSSGCIRRRRVPRSSSIVTVISR